jgi:hypothetical protein
LPQDAPAVEWTGRQARRARWIVQDLLASARALVRVASHTRDVDRPVGIGILEGAPRAVVGRPNAYRLRLVNDTPDAVSVTLHLHGETTGRSFATRSDHPLAGHVTREVVLVTDWVERFELIDASPGLDAIESSLAPDDGRRCRLAAMLESAGERVEELAIVQPLVSCASSI